MKGEDVFGDKQTRAPVGAGAPVIDEAVAEVLRKAGDTAPGTGGLHPVESAVLGGLLLMVVSFLLLQMFGRYVGTSAVGWAEEAARYTYIWLVFLGAGVAVRTRSHILADVLRPKTEGLWSTVWLVLLEAITALAAACLVKYGADLARVSSNMHTVSLGISMGWIMAAVPVGAALIFVFSVGNIVRLLRKAHGSFGLRAR
jgi:TRAP-type C4-dicarboxylate transport system permease small subunit